MDSPAYRNAKLILRWEENGSTTGATCQISLGTTDMPLENSLRDYLSFTVPVGQASLYFGKVSAEDAAAMQEAVLSDGKTIAGKWTSTFLNIYDPETQQSHNQILTDYSFAIREDGTFSAVLNQPYSGTWYFQSADIHEEYNSTTYQYCLCPEGSDDQWYLSILNGEELHFYHESIGSITMAKLTPEQLREFEKGPDLLPGTWTGTEAYIWDSQSQKETLYQKGDFSVTVSPDGTYTANLDTRMQNTWQYYGYEPEYGHQYLFSIDDQNSRMFTIHANGTLEANYRDREKWVYVYLKKQ